MSNLDKPVKVLDTKTKGFERDSKLYNIDFSLTDTAIVIEFKFQDTIEAAANYTLDELQNQSRYFIIFKDLKEAYEALKPLDYTVTYSTYLYNLIFPIKFKSIDSFTFTVPIFNSDSRKYKQLIEQYTNRIDRIQRIISGKGNEPPKDAYKPKIDAPKHEVISILTQEEYDWLASIGDLGKKKIQLLYHPCKETDKISIFIDCCLGENRVYLIIETVEGIKFGGYAERGLIDETKENNDRSNSGEFYFFSFDRRKKYFLPSQRSYQRLTASKYSLWFFDEFELEDRFMRFKNEIDMSYYGYNALEEINNGENNFCVKDLYVFKEV